MREINFRLDGTSPILLHSNRGVDPLCIYTKALKPLTAKRGPNKTDADHLLISRIEWEGGLYLDDDGYVSVPIENIHAMLKKAGRKTKNGKKIEQGVSVSGNFCRLKFPDDKIHLKNKPTTPDDLPSKDLDPLFEKYFDRRVAKPKGQGSVIRTRARFDKWSLCCTVSYDPDVIDERTLLETMTTAGKYEGLGDYREKYGHFEPTVIQ